MADNVTPCGPLEDLQPCWASLEQDSLRRRPRKALEFQFLVPNSPSAKCKDVLALKGKEANQTF